MQATAGRVEGRWSGLACLGLGMCGALTAIAAACDSPEAPVDLTPATVPIPREVGEEFAQAICTRYSTCGCAAGLDIESCRADVLAVFDEFVAQGGRYIPELFDQLMVHPLMTSCPQHPVTSQSFYPEPAFVGFVPLGQPCSTVSHLRPASGSDCAQGLKCSVRSRVCVERYVDVGVQILPMEVGEPCWLSCGGLDTYCGPEFRCVPRVPTDGDCDHPRACEPPEFCEGLGPKGSGISGICRRPIFDPAEGGPCDPNVDQTSEYGTCGSVLSYSCNAWTHQCVEEPAEVICLFYDHMYYPLSPYWPLGGEHSDW